MNKCQWTRYILSRQLFVYPTATWHLSVRFRLTDTLHCHSTEFCSNLCIRHFQLPCSIQYTRRFAPNSYKLRYHFWYFLSTIQPNSYQLSVFFMPPAYIRHSSSSVDDIYPLSNIIHKKTNVSQNVDVKYCQNIERIEKNYWPTLQPGASSSQYACGAAPGK